MSDQANRGLARGKIDAGKIVSTKLDETNSRVPSRIRSWDQMSFEERLAWTKDCLPSAGHSTLTEIALAATVETRDEVIDAYWDFIDNGL